MRNFIGQEQLITALQQAGWNKTAAGKILGVSEGAVRRWVKKHGVQMPEARVQPEESKLIVPGHSSSKDVPLVVVDHEPLIVVPKVTVGEKGPGLERVFVISDVQGRDYNPWAYNIMIQRMRDYKPTHCVIIGDFQDNTALMGKDGKREIVISSEELADLQDENAHCNKLLDAVDQAVPEGCKKYYIKGNHEDRADKIVTKPHGMAWSKLILAEEVLELKRRGWTWVQYNDFVTLGKLKFTHGAYYDMHHAYHHARVYCENVIYGHTHQVQVFNMPTPARVLSFQAISIGCLANVNPEWARGKPNAHDHAFAEVDYLSSGEFFPVVHRIINKKLMACGKVYKG